VNLLQPVHLKGMQGIKRQSSCQAIIENLIMEVSAKLKDISISAQKCRLVADQIRGLEVSRAVEILAFSPKKASHIVKKVLDSAIANAEHNEGADIDELKVTKIFVDEGRTQKRFQPRAKGRACKILKRSSHLTVTVGDNR